MSPTVVFVTAQFWSLSSSQVITQAHAWVSFKGGDKLSCCPSTAQPTLSVSKEHWVCGSVQFFAGL